MRKIIMIPFNIFYGVFVIIGLILYMILMLFNKHKYIKEDRTLDRESIMQEVEIFISTTMSFMDYFYLFLFILISVYLIFSYLI